MLNKTPMMTNYFRSTNWWTVQWPYARKELQSIPINKHLRDQNPCTFNKLTKRRIQYQCQLNSINHTHASWVRLTVSITGASWVQWVWPSPGWVQWLWPSYTYKLNSIDYVHHQHKLSSADYVHHQRKMSSTDHVHHHHKMSSTDYVHH